MIDHQGKAIQYLSEHLVLHNDEMITFKFFAEDTDIDIEIMKQIL